jgi:transcriptional regulator with XRE-family HTH domain
MVQERREEMALRLKIERERKGLSQSQLARKCNIHPSTLSRLEAGKTYAYPKWRRSLARVLGVPADELFAEVNESESHGDPAVPQRESVV